MQWLMLQQDEPDDFVIATGLQYSVRDFVDIAYDYLGKKIRWEAALQEKDMILKQESSLFLLILDIRPSEVETLLGDPSKARKSCLGKINSKKWFMK